MDHSIKFADDFASSMQQLSAEANKSFPADETQPAGSTEVSEQLSEALREFRVMSGRVQRLESTLTKRLEEISEALPKKNSFDIAQQLRKMEEHITAIRNTESVNQRLFDSLHKELISYRDNFLHESLQKPFIRDLVVLFDYLSGLSAQLKTASGAENPNSPVARWQNNLENAIHSLVEMLHRLEVNEIEPKEMFDRIYHRVVSYEPADFAEEDGRIVMRVKRGFLWRDKVLRPEEVIAKRFN